MFCCAYFLFAEFFKLWHQIKCSVTPKDAPSLEEWMEDNKNIRPYRIGASEVAFYQLVLELNDVAKAFLMVDDFINNTNFYTLKCSD